MNESFFHLAKPKRKGILPLIFSRFLFLFLLFVFQIALAVLSYTLLRHYFPWISGVLTAFTLVMVLYLFNCPMDATGKLTWMLLIAVFPIPGAFILWFTRKNFLNRRLSDEVNSIAFATENIIEPDPETLSEIKEKDLGTYNLYKYVNKCGCFPFYEGTKLKYYDGGEEVFEDMLLDLREAKESIFIESFIIEESFMWGEVLKILIDKAGKGLDVRVLYDGTNEIRSLPMNYDVLLKRCGIKAKPFSPIKPVLSSSYNYRDHRKVVVIDSNIAYNASSNFADEYINRKILYGHWKDAGLRITGSAVRSFTLMFLQMWNVGETEQDFKKYVDIIPKKERTAGYVMPYADSPLDNDKVGETVYLDILNRASKYVHIMTPYLILDGELENALKYAAMRGIDVKIILPGIPDKKVAYAFAKAHYRRLLEAGVKIYEYTPGFIHSKVFVSDDVKAVVGTINLDYRSLYHHFECGTYLYECGVIKDIEKDYKDTLKVCSEVTFETIKKEKIFYKVTGNLLKFLAPLM